MMGTAPPGTLRVGTALSLSHPCQAGMGESTALISISERCSAQALGQTKGLGKHLRSKHP